MHLILLGPPGTGKGTQAKLIEEKLNIVHVATGDLFREAVRQGTELGKQVGAYMERGELVPDELTIATLLERIRQPDAREGAIFDGFPRTIQQAQALDQALEDQGMAVKLALLIDAPDDEIVRRLSGRWLCPSCGMIYHEVSQPPAKAKVCDGCDGELIQRDDDKPDVVRNRLEQQRPSEEMLAHYRKQDKLVEIDGAQNVDAVTRILLAAIDKANTGS